MAMPVVHPKRPFTLLSHTPVASAVLLALSSPAAMAQEQQATALGEVFVTAQKRSENLQDVPISLESISNESIEQLNIQNFKTYTQYLPTVSTQQSMQTGGGYNLVYMRGVATGGDGQAITSQPSVGTYLDEQPITTIRGNLDVHLYDIARVEALAGPQGTLYGASAQAGTIRIITNKPDPDAFASGYSVEGNYVDGDEFGYVAEGSVNIPMAETAAVRLVGWAKHEPGWIDNVEATRLYPGNLADPADDVEVNNAEFVEDNYNTIDTIGARAALRIDLGDNWTLTPAVMYQKSENEGSWGDDFNDFIPEAAGRNKVAHFRDEFYNDEWYQAGLTIEGSINNFDVVYSGNYLNREDEGSTDYSDYSYFYDLNWSTGPYAGTFANLFVDNDGNYLNRAHSYTADDYYTKVSHEVRLSTPVEKRVRGLLGFFYQKQYHDFHEEFGNIEGLADFMSMNFLEPESQRFPGVVYLNSMDRTDIEEAVFGQIQFDITDTLELSLGARYFDVENKVHGFFGFGLGFNPGRVPGSSPDDIQPTEPGEPPDGDGVFLPGGAGWSRNGEWRCPSQEDRKDAPCVNANRSVTESDNVLRVNLSWKAADTALLYATWSEGFRPGGINRNPAVPDYVPDFLTNYELGWKTRWAEDRLQFNGAVFLEEWDHIQVAFQGLNGITQVENGPEAEITGTEMQLEWLPTDNLRLALAGAYYDTELTSDYAPLGELKAPEGTQLPITAEFKGNMIARYMFPLGGFDAHVQGSLAYEGSRSSDLDIDDAAEFGNLPSNTFLDLTFGIENDKYAIELFLANVTDEDAPLFFDAECAPGVCGPQKYGVIPRPRTWGIRFTQDF
jgi:iron complex outermembrane receptor protein